MWPKHFRHKHDTEILDGYLSTEIQNDLIGTSEAKEMIVNKIYCAKCFAILLVWARDADSAKQATLILRYADTERGYKEVH